MSLRVRSFLVPAGLLALSVVTPGFAQTDPGVRPGAINGQPSATPTSPQPLASVTPGGPLEFFQDGLARFQNSEVVSGGEDNGLGPRFNLESCSGCHSQPAVGGSSPPGNPQFTVITRGVVSGQTNVVPSFVTANGPVREARFPFFFTSGGAVNTNAPNGGVETIYTVSGRADANGCNLTQPPFALAQATNNVIFRIPTPTFGAGLLENIDDSTLIAIKTARAGNNLGISGAFNFNGNDGTIARFGWKAQNKSLQIFSGEAYNVEMGITSELFPQERALPGEEANGAGLPTACLNLGKQGYPEDPTHFSPTTSSSNPAVVSASIPSDAVQFSTFMRLLAPPIPSTTTPGGANSIVSGRNAFVNIGCGACHTPTINSTQASNITASLGGAAANAFSDLEIHHMGTGLADNVSQGGAGGDQFRTAPLWGLGQRIFFLHDGRTSNLLVAIRAHAGQGSEANQVVSNFNLLAPGSQQDLLNFLRSL
jgi:CxxC motif-containing protein (DUF1111 family)